jgi:hypothetical protein
MNEQNPPTPAQLARRAIIELTKLPHTEDALNEAIDAYTIAVQMRSCEQISPYPRGLNSIECMIVTTRKDCKEPNSVPQLYNNLGRSFLLTQCDGQHNAEGSVFTLQFTPHPISNP